MTYFFNTPSAIKRSISQRGQGIEEISHRFLMKLINTNTAQAIAVGVRIKLRATTGSVVKKATWKSDRNEPTPMMILAIIK